jgi:S-methylmethionine-dependent homocysteine/selenocysteine methylase
MRGLEMTLYRNQLPQLSDFVFLMTAGLETELMFNQGFEIPGLGTHNLLYDPKGRAAIADFYRQFLTLAREQGTGFIIGTQTWKAHMHWAEELGATEEELRRANHDSAAFIAGLRDEFSDITEPIVLDGIIGPRGDCYAPEEEIAAHEAESYHAKQIGWLAETQVDMITAATLNQTDEAIGIVRAAQRFDLPVIISFTLETDGNLQTGQSLKDAIYAVDEATGSGAAYFMVNCTHPEHFAHLFEDSDWSHRIRGVFCNASRKSHAELEASNTLDDGNPVEFGQQHKAMRDRSPWLNVFGGCCGCDIRHVTEIAHALEL